MRHAKKNSEANTKVYDLNQKTMQALDRLAGVHATFEEAWANPENENSAGDVLHADACGEMDELAKAQQDQACCQEEVKGCRESLDTVVRERNNCRALIDAACDDLADAGTKTIDFKRKAEDVHDRTRSHRDRCRRATKDLVSTEEELNDSSGRLSQLVQETVGATQKLSCGVPDRDCKILAGGPRHDR